MNSRLLSIRSQRVGPRRHVDEIQFRPLANDLIPLVDHLEMCINQVVDYAAQQMRRFYNDMQMYRPVLTVLLEVNDEYRLIENRPANINPLDFFADVANAVSRGARPRLIQRYNRNFGVSRQFRNELQIQLDLHDNIMQAIENLSQSERDIDWHDLLIILRFDSVGVPARGKMKKFIRESIASDEHTKGLYNYDSDDGLCGYQAIIYALASSEQLRAVWSGSLDWFYQQFNQRQPYVEQLRRGKKRFALLGKYLQREVFGHNQDQCWLVSPAADSTANQLVRLQPRLQIVIYNEVTRQLMESRRGILFDPATAEHHTIIMSFTLQHLQLIRGIFQYFGKCFRTGSRYCYNCYKFVGNELHRCDANAVTQCNRCYTRFQNNDHQRVHQQISGPMITCPRCEIKFYNETCLQAHRCRASHVDICQKCQAKIFPSSNPHQCGQYRCFYCRLYVDPGHRCSLKRLSQETEIDAAEAGHRYYAFDVESMFVADAQQPAGVFRHQVNLICLRRCFHEPVEELTFHSMHEFVQWMEAVPELTTLFAHNLKGYDGRMVFDYLFDRHTPPQEVLWRGSKILKMTYGKCEFRDTLLHLPASLEQLPAMFGLDTTHLKKGFFPYSFNTPENQNYIGPIPDALYFDPAMMSSKKRQEFERWHQEQRLQSVVYDFQRELLEYCQSDVRILAAAIEAYMCQQMKVKPINPFSCLTIASYAMKMYMTYYMPPDQIFRLNLDEQDDISLAMHGGRTDVRCLLREYSDQELESGIHAKYQDVQSLYPTVQFYDPLPVGPPRHRRFNDGNQPSVQQLHKVFGFVCCDIEARRYLHHPVVVHTDQSTGRLLADLLPKREIVIPSPELHLALKNGYVVTKVYWWYEFDSSTDLFKSYFRDFLKFKLQASGVPKYIRTADDWLEFAGYHSHELGIDLQRKDMTHNPAQKVGAKLLCNSLWGKFGERSDSSQWLTFRNGSEDDKILALENRWINGELDIVFRKYSGDNNSLGMVVKYHELYYTDIKRKNANKSSHRNIALAAMVTSHARCRLWYELNKLGDRVLYHDTDSIIYEYRPREYNIPEGKYLGEWEVEDDGLPIVKFTACAPKCYSYVLRQPDGTLVNKTKIKGITLSSHNNQLIQYDSVKALVTNSVASISAKSLNFVYNRSRGTMCTSVVEKLLKKTYTKGHVDPQSFKVYPFGYEMFIR